MMLHWAVMVIGLFTAGAVLILLDHHVHHLHRNRRRADWIKLAVFVPLILSLLAVAQLGRVAAGAVLAVIAAGGAIDIGRNLRTRPNPIIPVACFVAICLTLGHLLLAPEPIWVASFSLAVLLVASMDAFSQLWGRLLGKHKLCPHLSPGKTVEGSCGGLLTTAVVAFLCGSVYGELSTPRLVALGVLTALGAVAGDLLFSAIKRAAGIKDFSGLLPGQGGVLDRFDSLILAAPVFYWSQAWLL